MATLSEVNISGLNARNGEEPRLFPVSRILGRMSASETIWLVGMMGAGKSAVGRALARRLSLPFIDCDLEIEKRAGCSVKEIFAKEGEQGFRRLEDQVIRQIAKEPQVVATGGGAPAQPGLADFLTDRGTMVYLRAEPETLLARIGDAKTRPMLRDLTRAERIDRLKALQRLREPSYSRARVTVDTDQTSVTEIVSEIAEKLGRLGAN